MALIASSETSETWSEIRDGAFQVVLLTQRSDDFWALPARPGELHDTWAPPGSRDHKVRSAELFGHPSITVSFNALTAIAAASGSAPQWAVPPVLRAIDTFRAYDGGYGTPVRRMNQVEINSVPRHTAMAAVAHLLFSPRGEPADLSAYLEPSIKWLLDSQRSKGGWPYERGGRPALGYLSTASALCALCLFLDLGYAALPLAKSIRVAVSKGYAELVNQGSRGIWKGDGTPPHSQIVNSTFALRLLHLANRSGTLVGLTAGSDGLDELVARFAEHKREDGWPEMAGTGAADPVTSLSALHLMLEAGNPAGLGVDLLITFRRMEAQGEIRGGRFVSGFVGEQFARPEAVDLLREVRRDQAAGIAPHVAAADPLNLAGIITPGSRISPLSGLVVPLWEESTPDDKMGSDPIFTNIVNASHQAS